MDVALEYVTGVGKRLPVLRQEIQAPQGRVDGDLGTRFDAIQEEMRIHAGGGFETRYAIFRYMAIV